MSVPPVPADVFAGTAVVITGGASGIGRATAEAFVASGAHTVRRAFGSPPGSGRLVVAASWVIRGGDGLDLVI
jgi:NAD(P)-dependent dehydrogenase (short-subunit alcohol dehydrogenase family)